MPPWGNGAFLRGEKSGVRHRGAAPRIHQVDQRGSAAAWNTDRNLRQSKTWTRSLAVEGIDIVQSGRVTSPTRWAFRGRKPTPPGLRGRGKDIRKSLPGLLPPSRPSSTPTPPASRKRLASWVEKGAYLISLGIDQAIIKSLPGHREKTSHLPR